MSDASVTTRDVTTELFEQAQTAGNALREKLGKDVDSAQQDKGRITFDPDDYTDILRGVMQKFTEEFPSRHPNAELHWGKGVIILRPTTFEERGLGQVAGGRWMLILATSGNKSPGNSFSVRDKLYVERGDIYLGYSVGEVLQPTK